MRNFSIHLILVFSLISISTGIYSQESVKMEFKNSIKIFKDLMSSNSYEVKLHQNTYVYDLNTPIESTSQHIAQSGDKFYYYSDGIIMLSTADFRIIIDSTEKTIYITDVSENPQSMNFMFEDSVLIKVNIEKKELKDIMIFNIDMYSLNMGIESVQYHFDKSSKLLKSVIIYYKEDQYYEDENHLNEKQSPIIEVVIDKVASGKFLLPNREDFIVKRKNEYIVAPSYSDYVIKDTRKK